MLVATLMVIAVSGYAQSTFHNLLEGDNTNFDGGTRGNWNSWGDNTPTWNIVDSGVDGGGKCLQLTNPSATEFFKAQLAYTFNNVLDQSKKYTFRFKAKCESGSGSRQLQFIYQNNNYTQQREVKTFDITGEWDSYEIENVNLDFNDANRILINFGKDQITFYIDDIEFGYYEETQDPDPTPDPTPDPDPTPTGSLNNTMYYDGTQWCLMLEDFEGKTIGDSENIELSYGSDGTATVAADPLEKSKNSLNYITADYKDDYYYIDVTLPNSKTLSSTYFTELIFDIVFNPEGGDNNYKDIYVKINNTSNQLGQFRINNANTESWNQLSFPLQNKYTGEETFRIYIGGIKANNTKANLFIDNIRLSVTASGNCGKTTQTDAGWMLDGNTLYISGKGDIADYNVEPNNIPWNANKDNISKIIIGEGITAIGTNNFYDHNGLESVVLPSTLEKIGEQGLYVNNGNNETKPTFTFHSNPTMGTNALNENSSIATLVLDDALSPFFAATSANTFNGGIHYKRTLSAQYSTITLPFKPTSGLENCTFYQLNAETKDALIFEKVPNTNLVADKPYIVKTEGQTPAEIDFRTDESITIPANAAAGSTVLGTWEPKWTMHGTYSTLVINSENSEDNAYGFSGNALKKNTGNMTVKPFRAYFTTPKNTTTAKDYLDVIFGGEVTGIERNEFSPEGITEIFSLDGKKHDCLQKGMNIVKMNNGSIKKIVIK